MFYRSLHNAFPMSSLLHFPCIHCRSRKVFRVRCSVHSMCESCNSSRFPVCSRCIPWVFPCVFGSCSHTVSNGFLKHSLGDPSDTVQWVCSLITPRLSCAFLPVLPRTFPLKIPVHHPCSPLNSPCDFVCSPQGASDWVSSQYHSRTVVAPRVPSQIYFRSFKAFL